MKRPTIKTASALALFSALTLPAFGQYSALLVPKLIQYQGRVATGTGGAWAGTEGYFVFALLVGQPGAETVLWNNWAGTGNPANLGAAYTSPGSNQVVTLPVNSGVFSIRLGDGSSTQQIPATVFFDSTGNSVRTGVKLAVWFSPSNSPPFTRLSPDVEFTSVPFAMVAGIAESVQDRSITSLKIADGEVKSNNIAAAAVTTAKIAPTAVTTAMLADQAITAVKVAPGAITNGCIGDGQVTGNKLADGTIPASKIDGNLSQSLVPPGTILPFGGTTAPPGYLMCAGKLYPKSSYLALSTTLNNAFGGDSNNFRVPDLRGRFLRGTDDPDGGGTDFLEAGIDPGGRTIMYPGGSAGNIGSIQGESLKTHNHRWAASTAGNIYTRTLQSWTSGGPAVIMQSFVAGNYQIGTANDDDSFQINLSSENFYTDPGSTTPLSGETRPINAAVNYIIKY